MSNTFGEVGEPRVRAMEGGRLMTKQADRDAVNINTIVARARATNTPLPVGPRVGHYGDFSDPQSYHELLGRVLEMQSQFDSLPAAVRQVAKNDPRVFLEMLDTDQGLTDLMDAGLKAELVPRHVEVPPTDTPVPPPAPPAEPPG